MRNRRQQRPRLQEEQRSGDNEIFGRNFHVACAERTDVFEVLLGDAGKRNGRNVETLLFDQSQQQIERPIERVKPNAKRIGLGQRLIARQGGQLRPVRRSRRGVR